MTIFRKVNKISRPVIQSPLIHFTHTHTHNLYLLFVYLIYLSAEIRDYCFSPSHSPIIHINNTQPYISVFKLHIARRGSVTARRENHPKIDMLGFGLSCLGRMSECLWLHESRALCVILERSMTLPLPLYGVKYS